MPIDLNTLRMLLAPGFRPGPPRMLPDEPAPAAWPARGTLPPGYPRKFVDPRTGRVFAAEEGVAPPPMDDDSSPSDRPPPPQGEDFPESPEAAAAMQRAIEQGPAEAPPPPKNLMEMLADRQAGGQAGGQPFRPPTVTMGGAWPMRQAMMAQNVDQVPQGDGEHAQAMRGDQAKLAEIIAAKKNPQHFGPEGMRPGMARMVERDGDEQPAGPGGLIDMRLKYLGQKPAPGGGEMFSQDENAEVLAKIRQAMVDKEQAGGPRNDLERVKQGWLNSGATPEQAEQRGQAWQGTMAQNEARDRQSLADRPQAHSRLAEHELFRKSPRAWMMWKTMGGSQPGSPAPDVGGIGNLAAMNYAMGDKEGAKLALEADQIRSQAEHGRGLREQAAAQASATAVAEWQKLEMGRESALVPMRDEARKLLVEEGKKFDPNYQPTPQAINDKIRSMGHGNLLTPIPPPSGRGGQAAGAPRGTRSVPVDALARMLGSARDNNGRWKIVAGKFDAFERMSPEEIAGFDDVERQQVLEALWLMEHNTPGFVWPWQNQISPFYGTQEERQRNAKRIRDLRSRFGG